MKRRYICRNRGYDFEKDIIPKEEVKKQNLINFPPVTCSHCGSQNLERK